VIGLPDVEKMYHYTVYGLQIRSAVSLAGLAPGSKQPEATIQLGQLQLPPDMAILEDGSRFWAGDDTAYVCWEDIGACMVRRGREIVLAPASGADERALRQIVLGPAMILLLQQRGCVVLHGSVVSFDGAAVSFLGDSGAGKSTLGAAFAARGRQLLADDLTVVRFVRGQPYVLPGPPELRLLPDSVCALGYEPLHLPQVHPAFEKRVLEFTNAHRASLVPLRSMYLLSDMADVMTSCLTPRASFLALARLYYLHAVALLTATRGEAQILQCAELARTVPVRRLRRHPSLSTLDEIDDLIAQQLGSGAVAAV